MLLNYNIENFKSIQYPIDLKLNHNALSINGAGGSGKSNLVESLKCMQHLVLKSTSEYTQGDDLPIETSIFTPDEITTFKVEFTTNSDTYKYIFSASKKMIYDECLWLYNDQSKQYQKIFTRVLKKDSKYYEYDFGLLDKKAGGLYKDMTRSNSLFLSTSVQLNSAIMNPVYDWFKFNLLIVNNDNYMKTINYCKCSNINNVVDILNNFNNIDNIYIVNDNILISYNKEDPVYLNLNKQSKSFKQLFALSSSLIKNRNNENTLIIDGFDSLDQNIVNFIFDNVGDDSQVLLTTHYKHKNSINVIKQNSNTMIGTINDNNKKW